MKILLFQCKKAQDGSIFDFPFEGDKLLFLLQPVKSSCQIIRRSVYMAWIG